jgi:predicted dehydrogenase
MTNSVASFREIGVALAGTGFMGWVHAEALRRIGVRLVGVLGSTPAKSVHAAEQYGADRAYDSYDDLLSDSDVDAVHVLTPNRLHLEMASRGLESGKHVLCEKPLAMTSAESAQLVDIAARNPQLAAGVNYNLRYYPLCIEARERIRQGDLGDLFHVTGSYAQDWLLEPTDYNWRVLSEEGGQLRAMSDVGTHWLDLVQFVTGRTIVAVCADLKTIHPTRYRPKREVGTFAGKQATDRETEAVSITTDDFGCVLLRFDDDTRGSMWVSQVSAGRKNCVRFEIAGATQTVAWNSELPNELWVGKRDGANERFLRDPAMMAAASAAASDYPGGHNEGYDDTFKHCFRAFYSHIAEGDFAKEPSFPTFSDGHREIVLCDAIALSASERRWVEDEGDSR